MIPRRSSALSYTAWGALKAGAVETWNLVDRTMNFLRRLVTGKESADQLSGTDRDRPSFRYGIRRGRGLRPRRIDRIHVRFDRSH